MTEFTEQPQEVKEVPQETQEVTEARQELDRATLEPAAAVEKTVDMKTSEAVETAVKEAVDAALPAAGDRGPETGDRVEADASTEDRGPGTESQPEAERAARAEFVQDTEAVTRESTSVDLEDSFDLNAEEVNEKQDTPSVIPDQEAKTAETIQADSGPRESVTLQEDQERPSYDPDLKPEPAGAAGEAPSGESSSQSEAGAETSGKAALGEPTADPARSYSGVEMSQGEVAQDSDWNEGTQTGEALVPEVSPAAISEGLAAAGEGSGELVVEIAPESAVGESPEAGHLANEDLQNMLQHQQQVIGMMSQISKLVHDTETAVIRNADGGSTQTAAEGTAESEDPMAAQAEGAMQEIGNQAQLEMMDLQNALQRQQQIIQMMSNISKILEDSSMALIRDIGGTGSAESAEAEVEFAAEEGQDHTLVETEFEDFTQKSNQLFTILAPILKAINEMESVVERNFVEEQTDLSDGDQPADEGSSQDPTAVKKILQEYNTTLDQTIQDLQNFISDGRVENTASYGEGNAEQGTMEMPEDSTIPEELVGAVIEDPIDLTDQIPETGETSPEGSDATTEIQERIAELIEKKSELQAMISRFDEELSKFGNDEDFYHIFPEPPFGTGNTEVSWLILLENNNGSYSFGSDYGIAQGGPDWSSQMENLRSDAIAAMQDGKHTLQNEISGINAEIAKLMASLEE